MTEIPTPAQLAERITTGTPRAWSQAPPANVPRYLARFLDEVEGVVYDRDASEIRVNGAAIFRATDREATAEAIERIEAAGWRLDRTEKTGRRDGGSTDVWVANNSRADRVLSP